jgi:hypothetical protein
MLPFSALWVLAVVPNDAVERLFELALDCNVGRKGEKEALVILEVDIVGNAITVLFFLLRGRNEDRSGSSKLAMESVHLEFRKEKKP